MTKSIPDRWLEYKPYGTVIEGTNIVAFKVPLKEGISWNLPLDAQFTPATVIQTFPKVRFIVDLTNTNRYYQPTDFTNAGISHTKIRIPGKIVPPLDCVKKFFKAMHTFSSEAKTGELIGVHCTHGINRTGYLICRYLVQQLGWEPQKSLKVFEKARGYPIEREAYVSELMRVPRTKLNFDTTDMDGPNNAYNDWRFHPRRPSMRQGPIGHPYFDPRRRGFANGTHTYSRRPRPYGYGGPSRAPPHGFGPRPPMPAPPMPPPPPPPPPSSGRLYGPRPHAYGMPPLPPPAPFPGVRFPPRMSGPPHVRGPPPPPPPPPLGPHPRLSGPGMPPRLAPPGMPSPRLSNIRKSLEHLRHEVQGRRPMPQGVRGRIPPGGIVPNSKITRDVDFTLDTFEENLTAGARG